MLFSNTLTRPQAALEHPFEPGDVPLSSSATSSSPPSSTADSVPAPTSAAPTEPTPDQSTSDWQSTYASHLSEWRAQSASARSKAELTRANWESIRAREETERRAFDQSPESWDGLGDHITTSVAAANEVVSRALSDTHSHSLSLSASVTSLRLAEHPDNIQVQRVELEEHKQPEEGAEPAAQGKLDGSPTQPWEHISSSPTSSYPSLSFPEASVPQSPSHQHTLLVPTSTVRAEAHPRQMADHNPTNVPPSILPSIMNDRVAPRTRLSLVLSSLAINLLLPFINGVMLGFGEIFAKEVVIGWFGWKSRNGSTAAGLGLRR